MLDLEALFSVPSPASVPSSEINEKSAQSPDLSAIPPIASTPTDGKVGHSGHNGNGLIFAECAQPERPTHAGFDGLGTVGTVGTVDFQGGEDRESKRAPVGCAARNEFALHPVAVILLLAWSRKVAADREERNGLLANLETMPLDEQVRYWHRICLDAGLNPWLLIAPPASLAGADCTCCRYLVTRQYAEHGRRKFHWGCGLGYLILETGRGAERIWIAPPECNSYERWYPTSQR